MIINQLHLFFPIAILAVFFIPYDQVIDRVALDYFSVFLVNFLFLIYLLFYDSLSSFISFYKRHLKLIVFSSIFLLFSTISIIKASNIPASLVTLSQFYILIISILNLFYYFNNFKVSKSQLLIILFLFTFFEIYASFNKIIYDIFNSDTIERSRQYSGYAGNINILSFTLLLKIPFFVTAFFFASNKYLKWIILLLITSILMLLFFLQSRGAYVGLFSIYISFIAFGILRKKTRPVLLFSTILVLSFLTVFGIQKSKKTTLITERISTIRLTDSDNSISSRLQFYNDALTSFIQNPILGIGVGNWKLNSIEYRKNTMRQYIVPYHSHNEFLNILAESGIISLLSFLGLIFYIPLHYLKIKQFNIVKVSSVLVLLILLIDSNLNFPLIRPYSYIQYFVIMIPLLININKNE